MSGQQVSPTGPGSPAPQVLVHATAEDLAEAVARRLVDVLVTAQAQDRVPAVALTGGTIAMTIHERIVEVSGERVDWSRVDLWWGDERYVPAGDPDRNDRQAAESLLDHVGPDPARVHAMPASDGGYPTLDAAASAYDAEVRGRGGEPFDVVMLGVGPDGHVASLFPGHRQLDAHGVLALGVTDSPKPPPERITLTFEALAASRSVWLVVSGEGKAEAVARALAAGGDAADLHEVPAAGVQGREETVWFLDEASAGRL